MPALRRFDSRTSGVISLPVFAAPFARQIEQLPRDTLPLKLGTAVTIASSSASGGTMLAIAKPAARYLASSAIRATRPWRTGLTLDGNLIRLRGQLRRTLRCSLQSPSPARYPPLPSADDPA